ncbi:MAG: PAN domain-containing protein [Pseudomonadota bacterium]
MRGVLRTLAATAFMLAGSFDAVAADKAIIVMDASGSMWGQIDGKTKIEIARETLGTVLSTVPTDLELGLIAYGHREKGQCSDIEEVVSVGTGNRSQITDAVNGFNPKGKTPLTQAVRQAAESLRYTEDKATVILVTDGIETCEADPCAAATELENAGIDFTAHVVGFGLSEEEGQQVACLANNTGGDFILADNANELGEALTKTVVAPPPSPPAPEFVLLDGMEDGIDRPGSDYRSFDLTAPAPALCQATCRDEQQCVAWTFVKPGVQGANARCWLKNPQPAQVANDCCISGVFEKEVEAQPAEVRAVLTPGGPPVEGGRWDVTNLDTNERKTVYPTVLNEELAPGNYRITYRVNRVEKAIDFTVADGTPANGEIVLNAGVVSLEVAYQEGEPITKDVSIRLETGQTTGDTQYGTYNAVVPAGPATVTVRSGRAEQTFNVDVIAGEALARTLILPAGRVTASSTFTPGGETVPDARYRIKEAKASLTGDQKVIETQYGKSNVILPPGDYIMEVGAGRASGELPFTVKQNELTEMVVPIDAGVVGVSAPGARVIRVLTKPSAMTGRQVSLEVRYDETMQLVLNSGTYVATAEIGEDKTLLEKEFTITAGQRTDVTLP